MEEYGIDAIPYQHGDMDKWRDNFKGIDYLHKPTGFVVSGAIDDVWVKGGDELIIADYKATSKDGEVNLDADWQDGYKRQMEVYQWLFRKNEFKVSDTGYFVYVNGKTDVDTFDGKLEFDIKILSYTGNADWMEDILIRIKRCLDDKRVPKASDTCDYCMYREFAGKKLQKIHAEQASPKKVSTSTKADESNNDLKLF